MRKILLASHGSLAEGMRSAVAMILGSGQACEAFGLDTYEDPERIFGLIEAQIQKEPDTQFLVITDINGGSVQNQMLHLLDYPNVYVQTGMCLSMVLEAILSGQEESMEVMMDRICRTSKENMLGFSKRTITESEEEELW